jgi:hypothetical protein
VAAVQIFLSTVSAEFKSYRTYLLSKLTLPGVAVKTQEDFIDRGDVTVEKLDRYIQVCDAVIHLVGDGVGAPANDPSQRWLRDNLSEFAQRVPELATEWTTGTLAGSYTQWEAWLAIYHRKRLFIAQARADAVRETGFMAGGTDAAQQAQHLARLRRAGRYPAVEFSDAKDLAVELLRSLQDVLPAPQSGSAKPFDLPPPAGHFVGRVDALADLTQRLCAGRNAAVVGAAGLGKTALAAAALREVLGETHERLPASPWPDGVVGLDLYVHHGMADAAWHALANRVKGADWLPDRAGAERAAEALRDQRLLIVVEGAEQADGEGGRCSLRDLQRPLGGSCRWLVLTRLLNQADPAERVWLQERLTDAEAGDLLDQLVAEGGAPPLPATVRQPVLALLDGHPLALTWAGKLLARGDEDPQWLLREWQAGHLPPLADPQEGRHTLAWLFDRSVSRLTDTARAVLAVAGCLAPTPVPLPAFVAALPTSDESALRTALRSAVQHGLLRLSDDRTSWQFAHVLAHGHARERLAAPQEVPAALADWLMAALNPSLGLDGGALNPTAVAACLEHAAALLKADEQRQLWWSLLNPLLYDARDRLVDLGWSALVEADLAAVSQGLDNLPREVAAGAEVERERGVLSNRLADLALVRGDLTGAERAYRASLAVRERLAQADPSNAQWQRDLFVSLWRVADLSDRQGDRTAARSVAHRALGLAQRLAALDPRNVTWQQDLSVGQALVQRLGG